jgi:pimeloyl-ACP methyl ester carboxylesterase
MPTTHFRGKTRREFMSGLSLAAIAVSGLAAAPQGPIIPLTPGPEVDNYKKAQARSLAKFNVSAQSRYVKIPKLSLTAHVLEAGHGDPVVFIHGGGATAVSFAPMLGALQSTFHTFAPDRPGCGLTDKIDYRGVPFREHAVDFVTGVLDVLKLPKAALVGNSMGGYWSLVFALARPERVGKLVLIGEVAGSSPPKPDAPRPPPREASKASVENTRALYGAVLVANVDRVPEEVLEADYAGSVLPGAAQSWDTMLEEIGRERRGLTYALRPELKNLKPETLFIWGDKDTFGPPTLGQEMASLAPHARCEVIRGAGHLVWLDEPEQCAKLTIGFLKHT